MIPPRCSTGNSDVFSLRAEQHRSRDPAGAGAPTLPSTGVWWHPQSQPHSSVCLQSWERKIREKKLVSFAPEWIISYSSCPKTKHFCWLKQHESNANWTEIKKKELASGRFAFSSASRSPLIQEGGKKSRKGVLQESLRASLWALPPSLNHFDSWLFFVKGDWESLQLVSKHMHLKVFLSVKKVK